MEPYETIGHKIRLIHNQIHKLMEPKRRAHDMDLTAMQRWILGFLTEHEQEDIYQKDIENAFSISRATASNMLKTMEKRGMIERVSVEHDARLKKIVLTETARKQKKQAELDVQEMENRLVRGISKEEQQVLVRCLDRMLQNLGVESDEDTRYCGGCCGQIGKKTTKKME